MAMTNRTHTPPESTVPLMPSTRPTLAFVLPEGTRSPTSISRTSRFPKPYASPPNTTPYIGRKMPRMPKMSTMVALDLCGLMG